MQEFRLSISDRHFKRSIDNFIHWRGNFVRKKNYEKICVFAFFTSKPVFDLYMDPLQVSFSILCSVVWKFDHDFDLYQLNSSPKLPSSILFQHLYDNVLPKRRRKDICNFISCCEYEMKRTFMVFSRTYEMKNNCGILYFFFIVGSFFSSEISFNCILWELFFWNVLLASSVLKDY